TWNGDPATAPAFNQLLPDPNLETTGVWETIAAVPDFATGGAVRLVTDSGDTNFYGTKVTGDLHELFQKSYSQLFTVAAVPGYERWDVEATARTQCVGTTAYVAVNARNADDVPLTIELGTPYGSRSVDGVTPGKSAYQAFNTRIKSAPAGTATVKVT